MPPWPLAGGGAGRLDPGEWIAAEGKVGRALAHATACVVRLDERLLRMPGDAQDGARLRIALESIPDLLWSEGVRVGVGAEIAFGWYVARSFHH